MKTVTAFMVFCGQKAASLVGIGLLLAVWQGIYAAWGPFALPALQDTAAALIALTGQDIFWKAVGVTALSALAGFMGSVLLGASLGVAAGFSPLFRRMMAPVVTIFLGVPPIAWVVLALLWFGIAETGTVLTVILAAFPLIFAATVQGMGQRDVTLVDMACSFGASPSAVFWNVRVPYVFSYVFPALVSAHGIAWKAALMAEVMGTGAGGMGAALAHARANLDMPQTMAWIILSLLLLFLSDAVLLKPLARWSVGRERA